MMNTLMCGNNAASDTIRVKIQMPIAIGIWIFTLIVSLAALLPHIRVFIMSFADHWFFTVLPEQWTGKHYAEILDYGLTRKSIINSLFFSSLSAFLDLIL